MHKKHYKGKCKKHSEIGESFIQESMESTKCEINELESMFLGKNRHKRIF